MLQFYILKLFLTKISAALCHSLKGLYLWKVLSHHPLNMSIEDLNNYFVTPFATDNESINYFILII